MFYSFISLSSSCFRAFKTVTIIYANLELAFPNLMEYQHSSKIKRNSVYKSRIPLHIII